MAKRSGGLTKWFSENWVDIGAPKKGGKFQKCGRSSAKGSKRKYPKPTNVRTFARKQNGKKRK
jgi:hypothetical protein